MKLPPRKYVLAPFAPLEFPKGVPTPVHNHACVPSTKTAIRKIHWMHSTVWFKKHDPTPVCLRYSASSPKATEKTIRIVITEPPEKAYAGPKIAPEVLDIGNPNAASDAATGAACAVACAEGALYNVLTNMKDFEGEAEWAADVRARALKLVDDVRSAARQVSGSFIERM